MSEYITMTTSIDKTLLIANSHYQRLLSILEQLSYQVGLVDYNYPGSLCGIIIAENEDPSQQLIPVIALAQLSQIEQLENFIVGITLLFKLNQIKSSHFNKSALVGFHSCHKLLLLAYSQPDYRRIGPFVAGMDNLSLSDFFQQYQQRVVLILAKLSTANNHANVLQHMQGYFRPYLSALQKKLLTELIDQFRCGKQPLLAVIEQLNQYRHQYPNDYLNQQYYLTEYPQLLSLCTHYFNGLCNNESSSPFSEK